MLTAGRLPNAQPKERICNDQHSVLTPASKAILGKMSSTDSGAGSGSGISAGSSRGGEGEVGLREEVARLQENVDKKDSMLSMLTEGLKEVRVLVVLLFLKCICTFTTLTSDAFPPLLLMLQPPGGGEPSHPSGVQ